MLIALGSLVLSTVALGNGVGAEKPLFVTRPWVYELAATVDCYFTIEERRAPLETSAFWQAPIPKGPSPRTVPEAVRLLQKVLPHCAVAAHPTIPVIVQIRDNRLDQGEYALSKSIRLASYQGSPSNLVLSVKKQYPGLDAPNWGVIDPTVQSYDFSTPLFIPAVRGSVRDLLTNYLPLSRYNRILWEANGWQHPEGFQTQVRFRGCYGLRDWVEPGPLVSFAKGRSAFFLNHRKEGAVVAACQFIETRLAAKTPHQVRWAMYFLGREKAEEAVSLLLKHLGYQYTSHPLLREAYPAVKALAQIGPAASRACLRQLQTEDEPLRRRLLCQVLLDQMGGSKATEALKDASKDGDAASRRRLAEAQPVLAALAVEQGSSATPP